ncbi:MAG: helix-turn-helix domain-containing protein [Beijerinckiaceae bacterium]|nr:helix-turn-helix domain-containing protein [Beijerinckiaceae bacterium]
MAIVRKSLDEIKASARQIDLARLHAATEGDIHRHAIEDGQNPDEEPGGYTPVLPARMVRKQLGMTQEAFAAALNIPLATLRNWEQGRVRPDPAARALLTIFAREPDAALRALKVA